MSDEVQPARDQKPGATRPRWTGRTRDAQKFRERVCMRLRQQAGWRSRGVDLQWRQTAWEAWHILRHYYNGTVYCSECAPFIRTSLFPAVATTESEASTENGASVDRVSAGRTVVSTEKVGRDQVPESAASAAKYPA